MYTCIEDFAWHYLRTYPILYTFLYFVYYYLFRIVSIVSYRIVFTLYFIYIKFLYICYLYRIISITMNMTLDSFFINEIESNFIYCVRFSIKVRTLILYISA